MSTKNDKAKLDNYLNEHRNAVLATDGRRLATLPKDSQERELKLIREQFEQTGELPRLMLLD